MDFGSKNYGYLYDNSKNQRLIQSNENQTNTKRIIPFISVISDFIEIKKKRIEDLNKNKNAITKEIIRYEIQRKELEQNIQNLKLENDLIVDFHNTFAKLSNTLREECGIDLKKDPRPFARLLSDYQENGYDMTGIVEQYNQGTNLKRDIIQKKAQVQSCENQLIKLQENIKASESHLSIHRKNLYIYEQLEVMKFGIGELNQLWLTVSEITRSIGHPLKDFDRIENPVAFFYERCRRKLL